jgi:hypothetical protein
MRTSGGRGADVWMLAIPVAALLVAGTVSAGGFDAMLLQLESAIRHTLGAGLNLVTRVF